MDLAIYKFENQIIRTIPYKDFYAFCLSDCLRAFKSTTPINRAIKAIQENLGDNMTISHPMLDSLGRERKGWWITESALTYLVSKSRTELGKRFNQWLHKEVLPSIRKTGSYSLPHYQTHLRLPQFPQLPSSSDVIDVEVQDSQSVDELKRGKEGNIEIKEINEIIDGIFNNCHIKPELIAGIKLNAYQKIRPQLSPVLEESRQLLIQSSSDSRTLLTPTKIGEKLGLSAIKVNQLLIDKDLQIKNENRKSRKEPPYYPTDYGKEFSTFTLSTGSNGDSTTYEQLRWYDSVISLLH